MLWLTLSEFCDNPKVIAVLKDFLLDMQATAFFWWITISRFWCGSRCKTRLRIDPVILNLFIYSVSILGRQTFYDDDGVGIHYCLDGSFFFNFRRLLGSH